MHLQSVLDQLTSMRLTTMGKSLRTRLENGDATDLPPEEFFAILVEDEYCARQRRKLERMIGRANFKPEQATIENIIYDSKRGFTKKDIMHLTAADWIDNHRNVILTGPTGCGKSFIAEAVGYRACTMGHPVMKIRYTMLFEEIHAAKGTGQYLKYLSKLAKIRVLIIDDFLMNAIDTRDAETLMDIIEEKDQTGSIIVTSQFPTTTWHNRLPDPTVADAICDRLLHSSIKLEIRGASMRKDSGNSHAK